MKSITVIMAFAGYLSLPSNSWDLARSSIRALAGLDWDLLLELTELKELTMTSCEAQSEEGELLETE